MQAVPVRSWFEKNKKNSFSDGHAAEDRYKCLCSTGDYWWGRWVNQPSHLYLNFAHFGSVDRQKNFQAPFEYYQQLKKLYGKFIVFSEICVSNEPLWMFLQSSRLSQWHVMLISFESNGNHSSLVRKYCKTDNIQIKPPQRSTAFYFLYNFTLKSVLWSSTNICWH
jgi:hypothetical protein